MKKLKPILVVITLWLVLISCYLPGAAGGKPTVTPSALVPTMVVPSTAPGTVQPPTATTAPVTATVELPTQTVTVTSTTCVPNIVANTDANIRSGPGMVYSIVGTLPGGASANVVGKNSDGSWWYIDFAGGDGGRAWIAGSVVTSSCIPATLASIAAPPTPVPPTGTCKDGYVLRKIKSSDKVCVPPSSKAQADADNAAAASRKATSTYGPDTCQEGFVWREAYSNDHVCVTTSVRAQALADNAVKATRWVSGAYGPHTCIPGFVWREAKSGDDVCVTVANRTQAAADNAAAASRKVTALNGPDTCISGYVWREAFSGDHVCVTPTVRTQTAADNAAAPGHTW